MHPGREGIIALRVFMADTVYDRQVTGMKRKLRQYLKMTMQNIVFPIAYRMFCFRKIEPGLVIMADGHSIKRPVRMQRMYEALKKQDYQILEWYYDFQAMSYIKALGKMLQFMKHYARANYVIISDNFLPVASCNKRKGTFVIQMWHGCGAFKKFGYDTTDDIPADYIGNVFKNYDLVPVSGPKSVEPFTSAMRLKPGVCLPIGVSATDRYFDIGYEEQCRENFHRLCPEAEGKKILLWTPTFRGSAAAPVVPGTEVFESLKENLKDTWYVIIKYHPHMEAKGMHSTLDIPTDLLLPVTDLLVTDYSSILFNYAVYQKPVIFYAPDLDDYISRRGFYLKYEKLPGMVIKDRQELEYYIERAEDNFDKEAMEKFYHEYMSGCDGNATRRILDIMNTKRYEK